MVDAMDSKSIDGNIMRVRVSPWAHMEKDTNVHSHLGVYARIFRDGDKNELLVIKKIRGPYTGLYDLPGGSLEPEELIEEALRREIYEETGCEILTQEQLGSGSIRYKYKNNDTQSVLRHIGIFFEVKIKGTPKEDTDNQDSGGCIWIPIERLTKETATPFVLEILTK